MLSHLWSTWRNHFAVQIATLCVLTAAAVVVASVLTFNLNLRNVLTLWGDSMQVIAYLQEDLPESDVGKIENQIQELDRSFLKKIEYVAKEKALQNFQEQIASFAPDLLGNPELVKIVPASFHISVDQEGSETIDKMKAFSGALRSVPGIEEVSFGQEWVKQYHQVADFFKWGGVVFVAVIMAAAFFVMANSIQVSISQRKKEIEVLELIGATARQIRSPYVFEGAFLGFCASLIGLLVAYGLLEFATSAIAKYLAFLQLASAVSFLGPWQMFVFVGIGTLMGGTSSYLVLRRINTGWAASGWSA